MNLNYRIMVALLSLNLLVVLPVLAQDKVATSAAPFLGINIGVPASAMGGAYVSMARDASALYWNPGAIAQVNESQANFMHSDWFVNTDYNWIGVIMNDQRGNAFGASLAILDYGEEEVTTVQEPNGTGERWSAQDLMASLTYARSLTERFSIGGSAKYIQQKIYNESASTYALDVGLLYVTPFNGARLGMSISNFGSDMRLDGKDLLISYDPDTENLGNNGLITSLLRTESWPIPIFYRVGVSMDLLKERDYGLLISSDALVPSDQSTIINVGGELSWGDVFYLRGGYKSLLREDAEEGLTAGIGIHYKFSGMGTVKFDYAYNDYGILDEVQIIGIGFSF